MEDDSDYAWFYLSQLEERAQMELERKKQALKPSPLTTEEESYYYAEQHDGCK